jgi:uncharacterized repeat protein (TIGR03803 family)
MKREKMLSVKFPRVLQPSPSKLWIAIFLLSLAAATVASAQNITSIHDFGSQPNDPLNPQLVGVISQGRDGNMWSTTPKGGKNGIGAAFRIAPAGKLTVVHDFNPKAKVPEGTPNSGLTLGTDGNFYGTMSNGGASGNGAVFKMTPSGKVTILYSFTGGNDGKNPLPPPIEGIDGNFYGTTNLAGIDNFGTVYKMTPAGKLTTIHQFDGSLGSYPVGPLVQGTNGNFYGTTYRGNNNCGFDNICATVFQITPTGVFTQLHSFPFDPFGTANITSGLVQGNDGNFYGTTFSGGTNHLGQVFKVTPKGGFTDLYNFMGGDDGANPYAGLVFATDGNFYGVTVNKGADGFGTVYKISPKGKFTVVDPLDGTNGGNSSVTLILRTNGNLYGDASIGGATTNSGTFFRVDNVHFNPFVSLLPTSGKVGATIEILGQGFTGTTAVSFNGTAAKFTVVSSTYMTAVVPAGATTGFVTVTTPKSVLKSNKKFRVTK